MVTAFQERVGRGMTAHFVRIRLMYYQVVGWKKTKKNDCADGKLRGEHWWATPTQRPTGGYVHKGVLAVGPGGGATRRKNSGFFHFYAHFSRAAASRHAPRKRRFMCHPLWSVLGSVFHVGCRAACALVLHCSQPLGHTACQAC